MTKTNAETIGYNDAGCNAERFLSKPCNRFKMPSEKGCKRTAGTRTLARQNRRPQFDEEIIARWPRRWQRVALGAFLALTISGILPMSIAAFQMWLGDVFGIWASALCIGVDAAAIFWLAKYYA